MRTGRTEFSAFNFKKKRQETYQEETLRRAGRTRRQSVIDRTFDRYFERFPVQSWEAKLYPLTGVLLYKHFFPNNGRVWNRLFRQPKLNPRDPDQLERRIALTKKGEKDHVLGIPLLYTIATGASLLHPNATAAIFTATTALQVPVNLFPIMLQRLNRFRATARINSL